MSKIIISLEVDDESIANLVRYRWQAASNHRTYRDQAVAWDKVAEMLGAISLAWSPAIPECKDQYYWDLRSDISLLITVAVSHYLEADRLAYAIEE